MSAPYPVFHVQLAFVQVRDTGTELARASKDRSLCHLEIMYPLAGYGIFPNLCHYLSLYENFREPHVFIQNFILKHTEAAEKQDLCFLILFYVKDITVLEVVKQDHISPHMGYFYTGYHQSAHKRRYASNQPTAFRNTN